MSLDPSKLLLQNQFGEESVNVLMGSAIPLVPGTNIILLSGATAPVNGGSGTGVNVADKGSLYIAQDTGLVYQQTGLISSPTWVACGSAGAGALLTGFSAGAGTIAATDTIVQGFDKIAGNTQNLPVISNLLTGFSASAGVVSASDSILAALQKLAGYQANLLNGKPQPSLNLETLSAAGAISIAVMETLINNSTGADFVMTLAAPSSQDGQVKIVKLGTATTNGATLAMTNIKGPGFCTLSGTTTLTFAATGDCAIFMAVGTKWQLIGGNAIAS